MVACNVFRFTIEPIEPWQEILMAHLSELDFDSFEETENGLNAYSFVEPKYSDIQSIIDSLPNAQITYNVEQLPEINWNEVWEKGYNPIEIGTVLRIRAEFHESKSEFKEELIIQPKMSFGTGHHETTKLVLKHMMEMDFSHKTVLDMGCGTAILGIYAAKKKAKNVDAIDIEDHIIVNANENAERNEVNVSARVGNAESLIGKQYDVILANINRNVLMMDMDQYVLSLSENGTLVLSGFLIEDQSMIEGKAKSLDLQKEAENTDNNWMSIRWRKSI